MALDLRGFDESQEFKSENPDIKLIVGVGIGDMPGVALGKSGEEKISVRTRAASYFLQVPQAVAKDLFDRGAIEYFPEDGIIDLGNDVIDTGWHNIKAAFDDLKNLKIIFPQAVQTAACDYVRDYMKGHTGDRYDPHCNGSYGDTNRRTYFAERDPKRQRSDFITANPQSVAQR